MNKQIEAARTTGKNQQCSKKKPWGLDHQKQISENLFSPGSNPNISMSVYQNSAPSKMLTTQTQKYWQKYRETEPWHAVPEAVNSVWWILKESNVELPCDPGMYFGRDTQNK